MDEISGKSHKEQADIILDFVLKGNNQYEPLNKENIDFPHFDNSSIQYLKEKEFEAYMKEININHPHLPETYLHTICKIHKQGPHIHIEHMPETWRMAYSLEN